MPPRYLKSLPRFNGDDEITAEKHLATFQNFTDNLEIEYDDVFMRMFCNSFEGDCREWFRNLPVDSISSWMDFYNIFMDKWAERKSHHHYLTEFYAMRRNDDERISKFNKRFRKLYFSMPTEIQPSEAAAKVYYTAAHHLDFAFYLRERRALTLEHMFIDAEEIENNLWACGKLPQRSFHEGIHRESPETVTLNCYEETSVHRKPIELKMKDQSMNQEYDEKIFVLTNQEESVVQELAEEQFSKASHMRFFSASSNEDREVVLVCSDLHIAVEQRIGVGVDNQRIVKVQGQAEEKQEINRVGNEEGDSMVMPNLIFHFIFKKVIYLCPS
eukprot:Gb_17813 [translate_table: standard]